MSEEQEEKKPRLNYYWFYACLIIVLSVWYFNPFKNSGKNLDDLDDVVAMVAKGELSKIVIINKELAEIYLKPAQVGFGEHASISGSGPHYQYTILSSSRFFNKIDAMEKMVPKERRVKFKTETQSNGWMIWVVVILLFVGLWIFFMRRIGSNSKGNNDVFGIGRSKATLFDKDRETVISFKYDVGGLEDAKKEFIEIQDFFRDPRSFTKLGLTLPRGILISGPTGSGKSLLAKAFAAEAAENGIPFLMSNGSDFVEMFVGVGASRIRDTFKIANDKAPCFIFIDDIDAFGRQRGGEGKNDGERDQTVNQLLIELDAAKHVIVIATTSRLDLLDDALLRAGRFDRQIELNKPTLTEREKIFQIHMRPIRIYDDVDAAQLAQLTENCVGADIKTICNEAGFIAHRNGNESVAMNDFVEAIQQVTTKA